MTADKDRLNGHELLSILRCPTDRGSLKYEPKGLTCEVCRHNYSIEDGVVIFLDPLSLSGHACQEYRIRQTTPEIRYDCTIESYGMLFWDEMLKLVLGEIAHDFSGVVLDVACGTLFPTAAIKKFFPHAKVIATDFSKNSLIEGEKTLDLLSVPLSHREQILCVALDVDTQLPFGNEQFDLIVGNQALHHARNLSGTLQELNRVLKPTGAYCFLETMIPYLKPWYLRINYDKNTNDKIKFFHTWRRVFRPLGPYYVGPSPIHLQEHLQRIKDSIFSKIVPEVFLRLIADLIFTNIVIWGYKSRLK